jgi:hypothetical protein
VFAVTEAELKAGGRKDASFPELRFISQEAEWFLAGILAGLRDGKLSLDDAADGSYPHDVPQHQLVQAPARW